MLMKISKLFGFCVHTSAYNYEFNLRLILLKSSFLQHIKHISYSNFYKCLISKYR
jgi:hypothetical protein